jgi:cytochrome c-type biogenesis protein CcmH/NrfG
MVDGIEKSLSEYCAKAERLIDEGSLEAALAIGQHILRHHPKYVEAYRVLAKATLEQGEVGYAADLFKRVLSADPEDLEARVGLGIIYKEEALEEALWQWERAFELAPGNNEIRAQLRRVREQLEGREFPRIELTRGALGRLYARGGLFQQAADEFRAVLTKDPQQIDIQVALAETLWRDGRQAEAEIVCEQLLEALPNCLKANLILGHIWLYAGREEESQGPFQIAHALDPENRTASAFLGEESPLTKEFVFVPPPEELPSEAPQPVDLISAKEEWVPGEWELEEVAQEEAAVEAELPDWLTQLRAGIGEEEEEEIVEEEGLPDWLAALSEKESKEPISEPEEEIPDWLAAVQPAESAEPSAAVEPERVVEEPTGVEEADRDVPDWLQQLRTEMEQGLTPIREGEPYLAPQEEDVDRLTAREAPEWLQDVEEESERAIEAISDEDVLLAAAEPTEEVPDRLDALQAEEAAEPEGIESLAEADAIETLESAEATEEVPDWLTAQVAAPAEPESAPAPAEPEVGEADLWREIMRQEGLEEMIEAVPAEVEGLPEEAEPAEEIPDWLTALQAAEPAELEEAKALTEPEVVEARAPEAAEAAEEISDWLPPLQAEEPYEQETAEAPAEPEAAEADLWREIMRQEGLEEMLEAASEEETELVEEIPDWLSELQAKEPSEPESVETVELAEPAEEIPDWLTELQAEEPTEPEMAETPAVPEGAQVAAEAIQPAEPAEEIPDWLAELQAEEPAEPEMAEFPAEPEGAQVVAEAIEPAEPVEEMPDWLAALQAEEPGEPEVATAAVESEALDTDLWREIMRQEGLEDMIEAVPTEVEGAPQEAAPAEEVPDWLAAFQAEEPAEPEIAEAPLELEAAEAATPAETEEETPDWLAALQADEPALAEEAQAPDVLAAAEEEPIAEIAAAAMPVEAEMIAPAAVVEKAEEVPPVPEEEKEGLVAEAPAEAEAEVQVPAAEIVAPKVALEEAAEEVIEEREKVPPTSFIVSSYLSRLSTDPEDHEVRLALARAYRNEKRPDDAWEQFELLVRSGYQIEELVSDLEGFCISYPDDARWHQLLGDAYMRVNRLTEALDAYRAAQRALYRR